MKSLITVLVIVVSSMSPVFSEATEQCLAGMRKSLVKGHFTGPLVCSPENATFILAGRTTGGKFAVYDYRYRFRPLGGGVMHGGQKVVVFRGAKYIGQYALSPPPYAAVTVSGTRVILKVEGVGERYSLDFSRNPPKRMFLSGEVGYFSR